MFFQKVNRRMTVTVAAMLCAVLVPTATSWANGLIISPVRVEEPRRYHRPRRPIHSWMPFRIKSQRVDIEINDALAETTIEQVFINRGRRQAEGTYLFPIATNAGVHNFTMWMNGREVTGELLDADRARRIYQSIVSRMRDPGLLQFSGRGLIQAKVFPIPAGGECRIKLKYSEPVRLDSGMAGYRFPLGSNGCRFEPIERFSLRAVLRTTRPLASVFSPSHDCSIDRRSEREFVVGLEKQRLQPEDDFRLFYSFGDKRFGLSLLTHRGWGGDGFFMARITPRTSGEDDAVLPKNICFVLDTSGSMAESNKIAQAKKALKFCITNLDREDRFNVLTFSTEIRPFRDRWTTADEGAKSAARSFIDGLKAVGGTDINAVLQRAVSFKPARRSAGVETASWQSNPFFIVFITDGEPTVGVTDPATILKNVAAANSVGTKRDARIFVLGVGHQVNTKLLDRLADDNGGARDYVTPAENLELKISAFYTKLANPVLANLKLAFHGVSTFDVYPRQLPDLFKGSELVVVGRYSGADRSSQEIELTGKCRGERRSFLYTSRFATEEGRHEFLPRIWAMRKIGFLLDELRLHGDNRELKNEVIRLSKKYGILTPYTSFLVQEDERLARRERRAPIGFRPMDQAMQEGFARNQADLDDAQEAQQASTGGKSVGASKRNWALRKMPPRKAKIAMSGVVEKNKDAAGRQLINLIGRRTFYREGVRWVDGDYDGKTETIKLALYSKAYYDFLAQNDEAGRFLAQGDRVVLNWRGSFYETMPADESETPTP